MPVDDLTSFVAEIVEFVVSGVLFAGSLALLLLALPGVPTVDHVPSWFDPGSTLAGLALVALAYAVGVVAEGLGRAAFERLLDRVTHEQFTTIDPDDFPDKDFPTPGDERERQRSAVKIAHPMLHGEVESQLKRLRIERVMALSLGIAALGLLVRAEWALAAACVVATLVLVWRVNDRFERYCRSIRNSFRAIGGQDG